MLLAGERHAEIDDRSIAAGARRRSRRSTDSCRSRRPRRAARTQVRLAAPWHDQPLAECRTDVAGGDRVVPAAVVEQQTVRRHRAPRSGRELPLGNLHRDRLARVRPRVRANPSRMVEKPSPPFHCATRPIIASDSAEQGVGSRPARRPGEIGRGIVACRQDGWRQLMPMPTATAGRPALAFDQDAGELGAARHQIVRPFDRQPRLEVAATRQPHRAPRAPRRTRVAANAGRRGCVSNRLA